MQISARGHVLLMAAVGASLLIGVAFFLLGPKMPHVSDSESGYLAILVVTLWLLRDRRLTG